MSQKFASLPNFAETFVKWWPNLYIL